nr:MAG TPA: hypothetical protein [Caudoviricetes sp.]
MTQMRRSIQPTRQTPPTPSPQRQRMTRRQ